jgi:hypothetical protein
MMAGYRFAVVLAATLTVLAPVVTLPAAAAQDDATTAGRSPVWVATYHGPSGNSRAVAEAISPDGATLFVTGSTGESGAAGPYHWATIAYNTATGGQRWLRTYQGTDVSSSSTAAPAAIAVSPDGSMVFVTGTVTNTSGALAEATVAYGAATGARLWVAQHSSDASPVSAVVSPDGSRVFVLSNDYTAQAYAAATGNLVWSATATGLHILGAATAGAMGPGGSRLFLTGFGFASIPGREEYQTAALDAATGATLWVQHYTRPHQSISSGNRAFAVVVSRDGATVYVAGQSGGSFNSAVIADNAATGALRWARFSANHAVTAALSPDGSRLFAGGTRFGTPPGDVYDTQGRNAVTGRLLWAHVQRNSPSTDTAVSRQYAMAVSPDPAKLFVTGTVDSGGPQSAAEQLTLAYDPVTGARLWFATFALSVQGSVGTIPAAITASPDSTRVFVTGLAQTAAGNWDFATVAYRA